MTTQSLDRHIVATPGTLGGKPRIAGRRISVEHIAIWHDHLGKTVDEICAEYELSLVEVHAALAYYYDHRAEIERAIDEGEAFVKALREKSPSKLAQRCGNSILWANSGRTRCSKKKLLFDHLVGNGKDARRNGEAEGFGGLEIDDELEPGRLHDRQVGRLFTFEDAAGIGADLTKDVRKVGAVAHQPADFGKFAR